MLCASPLRIGSQFFCPVTVVQICVRNRSFNYIRALEIRSEMFKTFFALAMEKWCFRRVIIGECDAVW